MRDRRGEPRAPGGDPDEAGLRPVVAALLRYGVLASAVAMLVGLLMLLIQVGPGAFVSMPRIRAPEATDLTSLRAVLRDLLPPEPEAVMEAGVLMLIATPVVTVGASAVAFALERDWLYVVLSGSVFAVLILGFVLGRSIALRGG